VLGEDELVLLTRRLERMHVKDRLGNQRGGSEWEPIKILLQRENSTYAPNSRPRILTRVCQGHVVTTDLPTLGTNPKQTRSGNTTQEAKDLAVLRNSRRTVREAGADGPWTPSGRSATLERTVRNSQQNHQKHTSNCGRSVPCTLTVREQLVPRGQSAASRRMVRQTLPSQKQLAKRIETKTLKNTR
jgi:hypothetical protein